MHHPTKILSQNKIIIPIPISISISIADQKSNSLNSEKGKTLHMGLKDIGETLPPGFRFYPSDEELVCHYLYKKISDEQALKGTLVNIDLHTCEPWQLPEVAKLNATEWYFFSFRDRKYATGFRTNRATRSGYWKATGKDRTVHDLVTREVVGMRKTLVFYKSRAPNGIKTGWIMHEFRLESPHMPPKEDWVLCRVFYKSNKESGDNSYKLSPEMVIESTATSAQTPFDTNNLKPFGYGYDQHQTSNSSLSANHHQHQNPSQNSLLNLLHFSQTDTNTNTDATDMITSKAHDHDYGFLWGMENGAVDSSSLEDIRYDHFDSNMVFI